MSGRYFQIIFNSTCRLKKQTRRYRVDLPDGNSNYYIYHQGRLVRVDGPTVPWSSTHPKTLKPQIPEPDRTHSTAPGQFSNRPFYCLKAFVFHSLIKDDTPLPETLRN
jgi:hypothetical protein